MNPGKPSVLDLTQLSGGPAPGASLGNLAGVAEGRATVFKVSHDTGRVSVFVQRLADGHVVAYVNACPHIGLELDLTPGKFLDRSGTRFICSMHGALFEPTTGLCTDGPCINHYLQEVAIDLDGTQIKARSLSQTPTTT